MALTLEEHDWPSVLASALRPSEFQLLTSWDVLRGCPGCCARLGDKAFSSLPQPLWVRPCTAGAEPFPLPPAQTSQCPLHGSLPHGLSLGPTGISGKTHQSLLSGKVTKPPLLHRPQQPGLSFSILQPSPTSHVPFDNHGQPLTLDIVTSARDSSLP